MVYNKLTISIFVRIILLTLTCIALSIALVRMKDPIILSNLVILIILQTYLFVRNMNQVNRKLTAFFESLRYDDINLFSNKGFGDSSFKRLYQSMQLVLDKIQRMNLENEKQKQYFQTITEHAGVGLLAINENGEIRLMNHTLKQLLKAGNVKKMSDFDLISEGFSKQIINLHPAEQKLINVKQTNTNFLGETLSLDLSVKSTTIRFENESLKIIAFQNIRLELEDREMESWQKIIRVLTHEVINSTGPIASATQTLVEMLSGSNNELIMPEQVHEEMIEDILEGLKIIQERSAGLEEFVNQFRKITLITEPRFETINLYSQFKRIEILYAKVFKENKIGFNYHINPETLSIYADKNMIEQLLINLLNNSIDACDKTEFKNISISAEPDEKGRIFIQINDNGKGIPVEDIDKVFIPFYTRKEGGSGIGLSLSRQIMRKHGGRINLKSQVDKGTTVMLEGILAG